MAGDAHNSPEPPNAAVDVLPMPPAAAGGSLPTQPKTAGGSGRDGLLGQGGGGPQQPPPDAVVGAGSEVDGPLKMPPSPRSLTPVLQTLLQVCSKQRVCYIDIVCALCILRVSLFAWANQIRVPMQSMHLSKSHL